MVRSLCYLKFSFMDQFWFNFSTTYSLRLDHTDYFLWTTAYKLCNCFRFLSKFTAFQHMLLLKESTYKNRRTLCSNTFFSMEEFFFQVKKLYLDPIPSLNLFTRWNFLHHRYSFLHQSLHSLHALHKELFSPCLSQYHD